MPYQKTSLKSLWWKDLAGSTYALLDTRSHGLGERSFNRIPDVSPLYGRLASGAFDEILSLTSPPSDFDTVDLSFLEQVDVVHAMLQMAYQQRGFFLQRCTFESPPVSNRALWQQLEAFKIEIAGGSQGAGPNRDGSDAEVEDTLNLKITAFAHLYRTTLSALTTAETEGYLSVAGLGDVVESILAYPGPDKILFFGADDDGASASGNVLYSGNGGGAIQEFTTDSVPFTAVAGVNNLAARIINTTEVRLVCGAEAEAAAKPTFAYADISISALKAGTAAVASWAETAIAAGSVNEAIDTLFWLTEFERLYIAAAGSIYVSVDNAESDPGTAISSGSNAIAQMTKDPDNNVWAVGAANTILRELEGNRGAFSARVGPSGGGAFTSIAFGSDGMLYAGNGQKLYRSLNAGEDTGGWEELYDAGASHVIRRIQVKNGMSQCIRIAVDDTTPGTGSVFESEDGGNTWRTVTEVANGGYADAYFHMADYNKAVLVGTTGSASLAHELSA